MQINEISSYPKKKAILNEEKFREILKKFDRFYIYWACYTLIIISYQIIRPINNPSDNTPNYFTSIILAPIFEELLIRGIMIGIWYYSILGLFISHKIIRYLYLFSLCILLPTIAVDYLSYFNVLSLSSFSDKNFVKLV